MSVETSQVVCVPGALLDPEERGIFNASSLEDLEEGVMKLRRPRSIRAAFSDPTVVHAGTGVGGRGTEEIKTNGVTGRLQEGEVGIVVEIGRPGTANRPMKETSDEVWCMRRARDCYHPG